MLLLCLIAAALTAPDEIYAQTQGHIDYIDPNHPGGTPAVFAPGAVSFGFHEHCLTISPDGNEMFYGTSSSDHKYYGIVYFKRTGGTWMEPEIVTLIEHHECMAPRFSPDGEKLFFSAREIAPGEENKKGDFDIFYVVRKNGAWSGAVDLGAPVNTGGNEFAPAAASDGTLYYQYWLESGSSSDIFYAELAGGEYREPKRLGFNISTDQYEGGPFIAPDGSYLLFQAVRPDNPGGGTNIYVSRRKAGGGWNTPVNLGDAVNAAGNPIHAVVSPDEKYLFFSTNSLREPFEFGGSTYRELIERFRSPENGYGTIYWIEARRVDALSNGKDRQ